MSEAPVIRDVRRAGESVVGGVKNIISGPQAPTPSAAPAPPSPDSADPAVAAQTKAALESARAEQRNRSRGGRASTLLTGGSGDMSAAPTARQVLLGS